MLDSWVHFVSDTKKSAWVLVLKKPSWKKHLRNWDWQRHLMIWITDSDISDFNLDWSFWKSWEVCEDMANVTIDYLGTCDSHVDSVPVSKKCSIACLWIITRSYEGQQYAILIPSLLVLKQLHLEQVRRMHLIFMSKGTYTLQIHGDNAPWLEKKCSKKSHSKTWYLSMVCISTDIVPTTRRMRFACKL